MSLILSPRPTSHVIGSLLNGPTLEAPAWAFLWSQGTGVSGSGLRPCIGTGILATASFHLTHSAEPPPPGLHRVLNKPGVKR